MKKIFCLLLVLCLGLVGCSSKPSALDITKENYEKYGYNYADHELDRMTKERKTEGYEISDITKAREFLMMSEFGVDFEAMSEKELGE